MTISIETGLNFEPKKSQVVLLGFLIVSFILIGIGMYFILLEHDKYWIPLVIGITSLLLTFLGWWRSQKFTDLDNQQPIIVEDALGNKISTHSSIIKNPDDIHTFLQAFEIFAYRQPVTIPKGIVDDNFQPIKNSEDEAAKNVELIHKKVETHVQEISNIINPKSKLTGIQPDLPK